MCCCPLCGTDARAGFEVLETDGRRTPPRFRVEFSYFRHAGLDPPAGETVRAVHLAGTFNGWSADATPLADEDRDGRWTVDLWLDEGEYEYKFVVNGRVWTEDVANPEQVSNDHGSMNSVLLLGAYAAVREASPTDDALDAAAVRHDPRSVFDVAAVNGGLRLRLRTRRDDVDGCVVRIADVTGIRMRPGERSRRFQYFDGLVPFRPEPLAYRFELGGRPEWAVTSHGVKPGPPFTVPRDGLPRCPVPEWSKHVVWYQVMLDRFRNGTCANDAAQTAPWTHDWYEPLPWERPTYSVRNPAQGSTFYHVVWGRSFGGDLQGFREKIPYLRELGVTAVYLNPVFESPSYHKYDTTDYRHIDPAISVLRDATESALLAAETLDPTTWHWTRGDRLFLEVVRELHRHGMRIIIDGVFNHVGDSFWAFVDVRERGRRSPYADWFQVTSWEPFAYNGWGGFGGLPEVAREGDNLAAGYRQHIADITRRWMNPDGDPSDGIDGWRLDVADLVPRAFWDAWRALVRGINPEAYVVGEIWSAAPGWVCPQGPFDAVMNYEFTRRVLRFFVDRHNALSPTEFDAALHELLGYYPWETVLALQNLVGSHDTDRIASAAANPDRPFDGANRLQDNGPDYDYRKPPPAAYRTLEQIALFQMTFAGAPLIWYGDEAGMWGADDPSCRKPMLWHDLEPYARPDEYRVHRDLLDHYRTLIAVRNRFACFRVGVFETAVCDDAAGVYGFWRRTPAEAALVLLHRADGECVVSVPVPGDLPRRWHALPLVAARIEQGTVDGLAGLHAVYRFSSEDCPPYDVADGRLSVPLVSHCGTILVTAP